ncbi:uncharacterized protein LOC142228741 [Haematobia irritans]|uniref:uncharacterized protein LOC142228741 n=1 Tax=Haematobia irritans TaxID=7368 RepID=UPI003F5021B9
MLRKRQRIKQIKAIHSPAVTTTSHNNARVTVQYIQPQNRMPAGIKDANKIHVHSKRMPEEELEIETIEYLDDTGQNESFIAIGPPTEEVEDTFYPNAIHCLLDLYKIKYDKLPDAVVSKKTLIQIWLDIARVMKESYFEFEAGQIQQKYVSLRQQYFSITSQEDMDNFDYFHELHNIYNDPSKAILATGGEANANTDALYKDDDLVKVVFYETEEVVQEEYSDFQSKDIVNKEHEFIDMVVAMKDPSEKKDEQINLDASKNIECPNANEKQSSLQKRNLAKSGRKSDDGPPPKQKSLPVEDNPVIPPISPRSPVHNQQQSPNLDVSLEEEVMTLRQFNIEQEKRHREQMALLDKQFKQHQMTLELLNVQLQELIKRMPPAL